MHSQVRTQHISRIAFVGLIALLAAGCSKMPADEEAELRRSFGISPDMPMKHLGVVDLRFGVPKRVSVGWGKHCTITATALTNGLAQMNLVYESRGEVIDGVKTQSHSEQSQFVFRPDRPGWLCLPPMGYPSGKPLEAHLVVSMRPNFVP